MKLISASKPEWLPRIFLALGCLLVWACGEAREAPAVEVGADGALRFATPADFFAAVDLVSELDEAQLEAWEDGLGFVSMRRTFREAERRLGPALGAERAQLLAEYADVLDPLEREPTRLVRASGYAALIDRRGIMYVGGVIHHVSATRVTASRDGDAASLARAGSRLSAGGQLADGGTTQSVQYASPGAGALGDPDVGIATACGSQFGGTVTTSDRREKYETRYVLYSVQDQIGNWQYRYRIEWEFWGYKKVLWWWDAYPTTYQMYNVGYSADALKVTGFDGVRHQYEYQRIDFSFPSYDSGTETSNGVALTWLGDSVQNVSAAGLRAPFFYKFHEETTSRGTYPTRGVMECGFCGDGTCQPAVNETASSCRSDCGFCGDGVCFGSETVASCYTDCHYCGDGLCDLEEAASGSCPGDCGSTNPCEPAAQGTGAQRLPCPM
jgi:hypothetical protein